MKFKVVITYDPEYEGYVVDVPELEGCMTQGKSIDEALENARDAIRGWIKVERIKGRKIPRSGTVLLGEVSV